MGQKEFSSGPQADWSREATRNQLISPVNLVNWGIFFTRRDAAKANDFVKHMQTETKNMGISCQVPFRKELVNEKIETLVQELRSSINDRVSRFFFFLVREVKVMKLRMNGCLWTGLIM